MRNEILNVFSSIANSITIINNNKELRIINARDRAIGVDLTFFLLETIKS